ncbi:histidine kinase [Bifidobacterium parmae]|nr:histidine kinase [Bifidobacterium parmae]
MTILAIASLVGMCVQPALGAWAVIASSAIAYLLMPTPVIFASTFSIPLYISVGVLSYTDIIQGIIATPIAISIDISAAYACGKIYFLSTSNIITLITVYILVCLLGYSLRWRERALRTECRLQSAQHRSATAHKLHDSVANDLSYAMMHIDAILASDSDDVDYMSETKELKTILLRAIANTRELIESMHSPSNGNIRTFDNQPPKRFNDIESQQKVKYDDGIEVPWIRHLKALVNTKQSHLEQLHIRGIAILPDSSNHEISPHNELLLTDFLNEIFINIAKYANPEFGYAIIIATDDNGIQISLTNHRKDIKSKYMSTHLGMQYYCDALYKAGGHCRIEEKDSSIWHLVASIPYGDATFTARTLCSGIHYTRCSTHRKQD